MVSALANRRARALALVVSASVVACGRSPHPWEVDAGDLPKNAAPLVVGSVPSLSLVPLDGGTPSAEEILPPVPVGGPWVRCYGRFKPSGEPARDVTRLGLLCGPSNGMRRIGDALEGEVSEAGAAAERKLEAKRGGCYRVFAVGEPSVHDLDVTLKSSRGSAIAADHGQDAWPIVQPDRPVCALEDDRWTVEVRAKRGAGRFAAEVWELPPPSTASRLH